MKILYVTTISLTMNTFFKSHIDMLVKQGHEVDIACNYSKLPLEEFYSELNCQYYQIDFSRSPLSKDNLVAFRQLKKVVESGEYDIVHCHTPNASVITRLVCWQFRKKKGLKVFYTAHGFHFYKGAPKLNWLVYYPIEKFCSHFTDKLITINMEDYILAKKKFKARTVRYIPGVGIDLSKFENVAVDKVEKRYEIGVPKDAFLLFSVGEVNENKNHQIIIKAIAKLKNHDIHYAIAGEGEQKKDLERLARCLGIHEQVHLLGYRTDISQLNYSVDVFCFPSIREGLGLAAIEAMACGIPVIASENRGTKSFIINEKNGFLCHNDSVEEFSMTITKLYENPKLRDKIAAEGRKKAADYSENSVLKEILKLYDDSKY